MTKCENIKVYDLEESIIACRNCMRLDHPDYNKDEFLKGLERAKKLAATPTSSGENNFLSGIRVSFDLTYTQYITKQLQRYHWFDYVASSSLMHRITKMDFSKCCNSYTLASAKIITKNLVNFYNDIASSDFRNISFGNLLRIMKDISNNDIISKNFQSVLAILTTVKEWTDLEKKERFKSNCLYVLYMFIISTCPMGTELFVRVSTNYLQLKTIYNQRKHHKLKEDYKAIIEMIESLPYSKELITLNK